jgi:hypothetical protein
LRPFLPLAIDPSNKILALGDFEEKHLRGRDKAPTTGSRGFRLPRTWNSDLFDLCPREVADVEVAIHDPAHAWRHSAEHDINYPPPIEVGFGKYSNIEL